MRDKQHCLLLSDGSSLSFRGVALWSGLSVRPEGRQEAPSAAVYRTEKGTMVVTRSEWDPSIGVMTRAWVVPSYLVNDAEPTKSLLKNATTEFLVGKSPFVIGKVLDTLGVPTVRIVD